MESLSIRAGIEFPATPAFPAPAVAAVPMPAFPTEPVVPHVAVLAVGGETVGIVGANGLGPTVPVTGNTLGNGTAGAEPIPGLPISMAPSGIPVRAPPPGVVGDVDVGVDDEVGVDDAAMLVEPEPHIPEVPDVSSIPVIVDSPAVAGVTDIGDIPGEVGVADMPVLTEVTMLPVVAELAGAEVPGAVPPPS
jgi:hypothetical protein